MMEYLETKTGRMVSWVLINFGLLAGLILGTAYEIEGLLNMVLFVMWLFTLVSWVYLSDTLKDKLVEEYDFFKENPYPVARELFWGYDVVLLLTLAYTGHFVLGAAYFIAVLGQMSFYKKIKDSKKSVEKYT